MIFIPSAYPKKEFPSVVPCFNHEVVMRVGVHGGGLNLEYVGRHGSVRLDAHVFVDY